MHWFCGYLHAIDFYSNIATLATRVSNCHKLSTLETVIRSLIPLSLKAMEPVRTVKAHTRKRSCTHTRAPSPSLLLQWSRDKLMEGEVASLQANLNKLESGVVVGIEGTHYVC